MTTNSAKSKSTKARTKGTGDTVAINVALPQSVHRRLRVKAINDGKSLTEAVTAAVEQWVRAS